MYEGVIQELIDELSRLPGIGPKSAQRVAVFIARSESADVMRLANLLASLSDRLHFCEVCGSFSEETRCRICRVPRRDPSMICVVEEPKDIIAIERSRAFNGLYHVLGGSLNPVANIGPDSLRIAPLLQRLADPQITEVIIATDPDNEGEATATYLQRQLGQLDLTVTRLATGIQRGGEIEYADEVTIGLAINGRRRLVQG